MKSLRIIDKEKTLVLLETYPTLFLVTIDSKVSSISIQQISVSFIIARGDSMTLTILKSSSEYLYAMAGKGFKSSAISTAYDSSVIMNS